MIVAEAGANDGLGFPFLFLPLYLILIHAPSHPIHTIGGAIGEWWAVSLRYPVISAKISGSIISSSIKSPFRASSAQSSVMSLVKRFDLLKIESESYSPLSLYVCGKSSW